MEQTIVGPTHYRLRDVHEQEGIVVRLDKYYPVKRTPKGYWLRGEYAPSWYKLTELRKCKYLRFVIDTSSKKYCYPALEDAIKSFIRRKEVQQSKLSLQLEQADCCVNNVDKLKGITVESFQQGPCHGIVLGETPSHHQFCFDY